MNRIALVTATVLLLAGILLFSACYCPEPDTWERVTDEMPAWSPDGRWIAFTRLDSSGFGLHIIDRNGHNERLLLDGVWSSPGWSPDSRWLVLSGVYRVKLNGDSLTRLTSEGSFPDWSKGNRIAYDSGENDPRGANVLWLVDPDGTNRRDISEHGVGEWRGPSWSPDGSRILFYRYYPSGHSEPDLAIIDTATLAQERLTNDGNWYRRPRWSPAGNEIVVSRDGRLWLLDLETREWQQLPTPCKTDHSILDATWSPDGQHICFSVKKYREIGWGMYQSSARLWVMDRDGSNPRQLTGNRK